MIDASAAGAGIFHFFSRRPLLALEKLTVREYIYAAGGKND